MCLVNHNMLALKVCSTDQILIDFAGFPSSLVELSSCCDSESSPESSSYCSFCLQMPLSKCLLRLLDLENSHKQVWY